MITKNRVILVVTTKVALKFACKFEAIKRINELSEASDVWALNKTPVHFGELPAVGFNIVTLPSNKANSADFTKFCHQHGFECGEEQNGQTYDTSQERCILCEIASYQGMKSLRNYNQNCEREMDCIIYESQHFFVTSELGALKKGYLMIVPKSHDFLSIAQLPQGFMAEYEQVCLDVETILKGTFQQEVTFMEHGSAPGGITSHPKSIVHAHVHVVSGFTLDKYYQEMISLKPIETIRKANKVHYFSYQEGTSGTLLICMDPEVYVQRQFPRQVMAEQLHLAPGQYNWRNVSFYENIKASLYNIHTFLSMNSDKLNPRIRERTADFVEGYMCREDYHQF